jgi:hypothetical protein
MKMFHPILEEMLKNDLEFTVRKKDDEYYYDINAGTRGGPLVAVVRNDSSLTVTMRYDTKTVVSNFDQLCYMVNESRFGGPNLNFDWRRVLVERDIMSEHE